MLEIMITVIHLTAPVFKCLQITGPKFSTVDRPVACYRWGSVSLNTESRVIAVTLLCSCEECLAP